MLADLLDADPLHLADVDFAAFVTAIAAGENHSLARDLGWIPYSTLWSGASSGVR